MYIDLSKLYLKDYYQINQTYTFTKEQLKNTEILKLENIQIVGDINKNSLNEFVLNVTVKGTMVLPCSVSLKPTNYEFETKINENLEEIIKKNPKKTENNQKTIDILPIIWENILMEIPIKVVNENIKDIKTKGNGWELITEEEQVNNPLEQLKDLL